MASKEIGNLRVAEAIKMYGKDRVLRGIAKVERAVGRDPENASRIACGVASDTTALLLNDDILAILSELRWAPIMGYEPDIPFTRMVATYGEPAVLRGMAAFLRSTGDEPDTLDPPVKGTGEKEARYWVEKHLEEPVPVMIADRCFYAIINRVRYSVR